MGPAVPLAMAPFKMALEFELEARFAKSGKLAFLFLNFFDKTNQIHMFTCFSSNTRTFRWIGHVRESFFGAKIDGAMNKLTVFQDSEWKDGEIDFGE